MFDPILLSISKEIINAEDIVLLPHINVDGDALGASLALGLALKSMGKSVDVLIDEEVPTNLNFLPGQELIKDNPQKKYSVAVNIDNGHIARLGNRLHYYEQAKIRLSIDHHNTNNVEADFSYLDSNAAATGEIVYDLIINYFNKAMDKDIALCLYTAIITDTGGFRYTNTTPKTLQISAELLKYDIDFSYVNKRVFDMISYTKLHLIRKTINSLRLVEDGKLAVSYLTYDDIKGYDVKLDDYEGLVNIGRNLQAVEVSLFLRQDSQGAFRGNLRSNNYVDVSEIAHEFGGGGHKRAAGFSISGQLEEVIKGLTTAIVSKIRGEA